MMIADSIAKSIVQGYLDNVQIHLETVQYTKVAPNWGTFLAMPDVTRLYFIREGQGWIAVRNQRFFPRPGQLVLLPAGQPLAFDTEPTHPFGKYWCHFTATVGEINLFKLIDLPYYVDAPDPGALDVVFDRLIEYQQRPCMTSPLRIQSMLLEVLALYIDQAELNSSSIRLKVVPDGNKIERLLAYIHDHLAERITIEDLASVVHFHPQYLSSYFKSMLGVSPIAYVTRKRLESAKQLLADPDLSISEVSRRIGLEPYYFSRLFKRHTGLAPNAYRTHLNR